MSLVSKNTNRESSEMEKFGHPRNIMKSVISETSQEANNEAESESCENHKYEKVEVENSAKVTDSMDKIFKTERNSRQKKKILMIGGKRMASDVSSSESREREIVKLNKNPLLLKNKELKDRNSAMKLKDTNINKELARKYANKLDIGKVSLNLNFVEKNEF